MNYAEIKQLAKESEKSIKELLVLAEGNDPFYVGSPSQIVKAKWFAEIYEAMEKPPQCHIRRVHYWLVSKAYTKPDGMTYENTANDWNLVTSAAKYARYAGLVPIENIIDRRNPSPLVNVQGWDNQKPSDVKADINADSIIRDIVGRFYCFNPHKTQAVMIEIWAEKSTMNDILEPIASRYGINLITGMGELSITAVYRLIKRLKYIQKPVRILYISDFDPAGEDMPVSVGRKIEFFMRKEDIKTNVKLKQIMLTKEQCTYYKLARTPIKETEKRKGGFEERHGIGATELDALEGAYKGEMKKIIERELSNYIDLDKMTKVMEKNNQLKTKVESFLQGKINNAALEELDLREFDEYVIPDPDEKPLEQENDDDWIYDSKLDYFEQLKKFKNQKKGSDALKDAPTELGVSA